MSLPLHRQNRQAHTLMQYLIQMSGVPGSGKTTVAREIGRVLGAVVLDHDVSKSALLSIGLEADAAGKASYEIIKSLTVSLLSQSHSVIIDSPCMYEELVEFGVKAGSARGVEYRYIECRVEDRRILESRIEQREARSSQVQDLDAPFIHKGIARGTRELLSYWESETKRPNSMSCLVLDTAEDLASCIQKALAYVDAGT